MYLECPSATAPPGHTQADLSAPRKFFHEKCEPTRITEARRDEAHRPRRRGCRVGGRVDANDADPHGDATSAHHHRHVLLVDGALLTLNHGRRQIAQDESLEQIERLPHKACRRIQERSLRHRRQITTRNVLRRAMIPVTKAISRISSFGSRTTSH